MYLGFKKIDINHYLGKKKEQKRNMVVDVDVVYKYVQSEKHKKSCFL